MKLVRVGHSVVGVAVLLALAGGVACSNSTTAPTSLAAYSQTDLKVGDGDEAVNGKTLSVNYTGWLLDPTKPDGKGLMFDTTTGRGPFTFTLGTNEVIAGWDRGVVGMKVGGVRRLVIPPSLGYGSVRNASIPPNSTLVFDIELLSVQ